MIASFQHDEDIISSTDLDVAYLQSFKWKDNRLMLICYWDFFLQEKVYEWIDGVIYGLQEGGHDWKETFCFRLCSEMEFKECLNMPTSSAEAETHAASEAVKLALHGNYVAEEIGLPVGEVVNINIDAGAALGFINNTASVGRMKHIDMRNGWVQQLRDQGKVKFQKVAGTENAADFFTKVLPIPAFEEAMSKMMPFK